MRRWLLAAVVTGLVVAACGSSKPKQPTDRQAVASVVTRYLGDLASGNGPAACKLMTKSYQAEVIGAAASQCESALSSLAYELDAKEKATLMGAKIAKATIMGKTASVQVKGQKGAAKLTKQSSGKWLLSGGKAD